MNGYQNSLDRLNKMARKGSKDKKQVARDIERLQTLVDTTKRESILFKVKLKINDQIKWVKEKTSNIILVDYDRASFFTYDEAEYIREVFLQNGNIGELQIVGEFIE